MQIRWISVLVRALMKNELYELNDQSTVNLMIYENKAVTA